MAYTIVEELLPSDYVVIIRDGCTSIISAQDFISDIFLGGFSICEAWKNCVDGIGSFPGEIPIDNTKPIMSDLIIALNNRSQDVMLGDDFLSAYYDAEGDAFGKIIVTSGDVSGFNIAGVPLYIGQVIPADQVALIEYDAKNIDASYNQEWFFEAYDINNVKAD